MKLAPEFLLSGNLDFLEGTPIRLYFDEQGDWSSNINSVKLDGVEINGIYNPSPENEIENIMYLIADKIMGGEENEDFPLDGVNHLIAFNPVLFTAPGNYEVEIKSKGYETAIFTITIPVVSEQPELEIEEGRIE